MESRSDEDALDADVALPAPKRVKLNLSHSDNDIDSKGMDQAVLGLDAAEGAAASNTDQQDQHIAPHSIDSDHPEPSKSSSEENEDEEGEQQDHNADTEPSPSPEDTALISEIQSIVKESPDSIAAFFASHGYEEWIQGADASQLVHILESVMESERPYYVWKTLEYRLPRRELSGVVINSTSDFARRIVSSTSILILAGAGISTSCGIPDFRSPGGLYDQIEAKYQLPDPTCLFDAAYIRLDPVPFFRFAKDLFPSSQLAPSVCHRFIRYLESKQKLLRVYTQNIDGLEQRAGISRAVQCHGSFATASCIKCGYRVSGDAIRPKIDAQEIPLCPKCHPDGAWAAPDGAPLPTPISKDTWKSFRKTSVPPHLFPAFMKPDIVFFGESLPREFHSRLQLDIFRADLVIVMGSSLRVQPVSLIPDLVATLQPSVPQILVNREAVGWPFRFDYLAVGGDCDAVAAAVLAELELDPSLVAQGEHSLENSTIEPSDEQEDASNSSSGGSSDEGNASDGTSSSDSDGDKEMDGHGN